MTPEQFMAFATPVILLVGQQLANYASKKRAEALAANVKSTAATTAVQVTEAAQVTADKVAEKVVEVNTVADQKLNSIHTLVNGTLTAAKESIAALAAQLAQAMEELVALRAENARLKTAHIE